MQKGKPFNTIKNNHFKSYLEPVKVRTVSAEDFLRIAETQSDLIEKIEFKAPSIGDASFGKFKVTYKNPMFCD